LFVLAVTYISLCLQLLAALEATDIPEASEWHNVVLSLMPHVDKFELHTLSFICYAMGKYYFEKQEYTMAEKCASVSYSLIGKFGGIYNAPLDIDLWWTHQQRTYHPFLLLVGQLLLQLVEVRVGSLMGLQHNYTLKLCARLVYPMWHTWNEVHFDGNAEIRKYASIKLVVFLS